MDIKKKRLEWEKRFPALDDTWTHWWIEADGKLVAVLTGSMLAKAIDIIEKHFENTVSIKVYRVRENSDGDIIPFTYRNWEISHNCELASNRNEIDETFDPNK